MTDHEIVTNCLKRIIRFNATVDQEGGERINEMVRDGIRNLEKIAQMREAQGERFELEASQRRKVRLATQLTN